MDIERLRALENEWRKESDDFERDGDEDSASAYYNCAERLSDLIAELGQEAAPVAGMAENGTVVTQAQKDMFPNSLREHVIPLYLHPAHTSEARDAQDAKRYRWLRDCYDPSVHDGDCDSVFDLAGNRFDEKLDLMIENDSYDASMRQEAE